MKLIDVVQQRVTLGEHMYWDMLYCADLRVAQDALRNGMLDSMLRVSLPEIGTIVQGKLLMESTGMTELRVYGASAQYEIAHLGLYRRYMVLPVFTVHVKGATTRGVEELHQWLGEHPIVHGGAASMGVYRALVSGGAFTTVEAWRAHHPKAEVHIDGDMEDYTYAISCAQVENLLRVSEVALSRS